MPYTLSNTSLAQPKGVLQKNCRRERIHITLSAFGRAAHFMNRAERCCRGVPLVHEDDGESRPFRELGGDRADFDSARGLVAVAVQRKTHHEAARFQRLGASDDFRDRGSLAGAPDDDSGW